MSGTTTPFYKGAYVLPIDKFEKDRMDLHHQVFPLKLGRALFRASLPAHPQRVLDAGTCTWVWNMEFADEFSRAPFLGNDLTAIQHARVPTICNFCGRY